MTILVADDNEEHLYLLQALLSGNGYEVVTAANGADGLAKARQAPPDLIVSDILMPVMDGFALCREWKKDERLRHIPFVFYTGTYTDERDRKFALDLGAEQFIVKPAEPEILLKTIREVIQNVQRPPAPPARVPIEPPQQEEACYLKQYNEALIRKLEAKAEQLAQANRQLVRTIGERVRAEGTLQESEQRHRAFFEQARDMILVLELPPDGLPIIRDVNEESLRVLGYTRDELCGKPITFVEAEAPPDALILERQRSLQKGKERIFEARHRRKDGSTFDVEVSAREITLNGKRAAISIERDITERKRGEEQIERLSRFPSENPSPVLRVSAQGVLEYANAASESLLLTMGAAVGGAVNTEWQARIGETLAKERPVNIEFQARNRTFDATLTPVVGQGYVNLYAQDITERKLAEEGLRASQQIIEGILNAIPVRVFWKDKNLVYLGCNMAFARDAGFASSRDIVGKDDYQMGWRDQAELYRGDDRQVIESGCPKLLIEEPQTTPEGKTITLLSSKLPLRNSKGEISGLLGTYMDITERKLAENKLRDSEVRYRRLFEAAKDGVLLLDAETGMVTDVNPFLIELLSFSHEQFLNKAVWDLGFFKDVWANKAKFLELQKKGSVRYDDLPLETADGRKINVEFVSNVYVVNHRKVIQCNVRDITERKRAQAAIRGREEELRTILKTTMEGVFMFDMQGRFLEVNDAYCSMTGYSRDELLRMSIPDVEADEKPAEIAATIQCIMREGKAQFERRQRRKDGTLVDLDVSCNFISTSSGRFVCFLRDVTERKRAETERTALDAQLRQAQKMESVGQLAGGVAHDFNNILTGISGYTELALERLDTASPMREDLAEVLRLSKRAAELTRQLLAFSRRQTLEPQVLNINDMIADTAKMLKRVLGETIDLQFAPAPDLGNVRADPMQLEQVLMNLALNARDAMPAGGKLTIETENVELDADYAARHISAVPGRYVMMAVSDTGHGMDAATQSRLFEPFFTTKDKSKGTGLGLATAYGIVKQHGGNIWVYSEPGKGATFKIYLPRVDAPVSDAKPPMEPEAGHGEEIILIVEDESSVRAIAERALKARGYTVLTASNAREAEDLFAGHPEHISLLLTDVVLPGINGPALYERLRTRDPGLKVLYMSGHADNATVHQGVFGAGVAFMQKPFTLEVISRKVRQVLDR